MLEDDDRPVWIHADAFFGAAREKGNPEEAWKMFEEAIRAAREGRVRELPVWLSTEAPQ